MLNDNIRTVRRNKGFTQEDLASRLHVTRQTVSKWEKGLSVPDRRVYEGSHSHKVGFIHRANIWFENVALLFELSKV